MTSMLPALSATFGNLKDVFRSAELAVLGQENTFNLGKVESAIVVMVDGLGLANLRSTASHAPFLNAARQVAPASAGFPSTTVVSLMSFATAADSAEHGFIGYRVFDRAVNEPINLLSGIDKYSVLDYLRRQPISERTPLDVHVVTLSEYENSGFTRASMNQARHHFAQSLAERLEKATELAAESGRLIYVYIPELDQCAHRFGAQSAQWKELLSDLDKAMHRFSAKIPGGVGALLTADHGIVDVEHSRHVYLDLIDDLDNRVVDVGGDPRVPFVYLKPGCKLNEIKVAIQDYCSTRAVVLTPTELVDAGLWSQQVFELQDLLPDLVIVALGDVAFYHRGFAKAASLKMIGQHGALSKAELEIPLMAFGAF